MKVVFMTAKWSIAIGLLWTLVSAFQTNDQLTKEEAIRLAEQFIIANGYTALPADKAKLSYELFDEPDRVDDVLKRRHNTLQAKAFCINEDEDRWHVGFLSTSVDLSKLSPVRKNSNLSGRAVVVMKNGNEIKIAHKDPLFSYFTKL